MRPADAGHRPSRRMTEKERDTHVRRLRARGTKDTGDQDSGSRSRRAVARGSVAVVTAAALAGGFVYAQNAGAAPTPSIGQVTAKINGLQAQVDAVGTQYDAVTAQAAAAQARLTSVKKQAGAADAAYRTAQAALKQVAVATFENGNQTSFAGLFTAQDPSEVLRQAGLLQDLGAADQAKAAQFLTAAQALATAQANVLRTEQGIKQLLASVQAKKNHLNTLLNQQHATLTSLTRQQQAQVAAATDGGGATSGTGAGGSSTGTTPVTYTGPTNTAAGKALAYAASKLGAPYVWGATGPDSFDCSGYIVAAYQAAGITLPRTSYGMAAALPHVPLADARPGDIFLYEGNGHVVLYIGNGMAYEEPHTGARARIISINQSWYLNNFDSVVRP
jgi:peptidoglycan DL-endopeptidase CwlO